MRVLRAVLVLNGLVFLLRAVTNLRRPESYYLEHGPSDGAIDATQALAIAYGSLGGTQIALAALAGGRGLRVAAWGAQLFALAAAARSATLQSSDETSFRRLRWAVVAENGCVALAYAVLLGRASLRRC